MFLLQVCPRRKGDPSALRVWYWMIYREPGFLAVIWIGSSPNLSPPTVSKSRPATHRKTEKERQLADGRGRGRGWRGVESYDRKKVWSSINHSKLSASAGCFVKSPGTFLRVLIEVHFDVQGLDHPNLSPVSVRCFTLPRITLPGKAAAFLGSYLMPFCW